MAYSTTTELEIVAGGPDRWLELADYNKDGVVDATVVALAIAEADGWINSYILKRFAVPVAATLPDDLVALSAAEAVYRLKKWRNRQSEDDTEERDAREITLGLVRDGVNVLGLEPLPAKSSLVVDTSTDPDEDLKDFAKENQKGFW